VGRKWVKSSSVVIARLSPLGFFPSGFLRLQSTLRVQAERPRARAQLALRATFRGKEGEWGRRSPDLLRFQPLHTFIAYRDSKSERV